MPLRPAIRRLLLPSVVAVGLVAAACDGPNRFSGVGPVGTSGARAPTVEIETPRGDSLAARPLGDSVLVRARVTDDVGVDSVRIFGVAQRGDPQLGTDRVVTRFAPKTLVLPSPRDTVVTRYLIATQDDTREVVSIVVEAFDAEGVMTADTTRITVGGPNVDLLNLEEGQAVQAGLSLSLQAVASDPNGVVGLEFRISGAFADTLRRSFNPAIDSVRLDTAIVIPPNTTGDIEVLVVARNSVDISGQDGPVRLRVVPPGAQDDTRPSLSMSVASATRLEAEDSVRVTLTGGDDPQGAGVVRAGVTVTALAPGRGVSETRVFTRDFQPPRTGSVTETVAFAPFNIDPTFLPDTLVFEVTAFMVDASGNCAAAVTPEQTQSLTCVTGANGAVTAEGANAFRHTRAIVAGRTVNLPAGGRIMDAAVDVPRRTLLLSNHTQDRVDRFDLRTQGFAGFVPVGSEPWGLDLDRTGDTLFVANSGGTNVSKVLLGASSAAEVPQARLLTPPVAFFDVERAIDDTGLLRYQVFPIPNHPPCGTPSFSDRPQFVVQDFTGRLVYSTKTTACAPFGTMRKAFVPPGGFKAVVVMFYEHAAMLPDEDFTGVANADLVVSFGAEVGVEDVVTGDTARIVTGPVGDSLPQNAVQRAVEQAREQGSNAVAIPGRFSIANLGFSDTTFVARAGNRRWAVFGEGTVQSGRVIMYDAGQDRISTVVQVSDILRNASERVRGIGLNYDGTLGVARGRQAYFFTTDLRLQGVADLPAGGAGAALHPLHANATSLDHPAGTYEPNTHLAFVGTGERTIDIVDTFHFFRSGRIFIRDVVSGPLRAVLPFPEDNVGRQCRTTPISDRFGNPIGGAVEIFANGDFNAPHPPDGPTEDLCIVLKLFGVTDTGGVVVVDVRKSDILRNHPARR
jgi:hypothetical protein